MKFNVNDTVYLAQDYPLDTNNPSDVIPAGKEGIVRSVIVIGEAYLVDFDKYQKNFLVPESWLTD
jgi:hypothetical protein